MERFAEEWFRSQAGDTEEVVAKGMSLPAPMSSPAPEAPTPPDSQKPLGREGVKLYLIEGFREGVAAVYQLQRRVQ